VGDYNDADHSGSRPQYRVLRRARQQAGIGPQGNKAPDAALRGSAMQRNAFRSFGARSTSDRDSDSEIAELEEDAGMLEAQLAWWRQHKETLLSFGGYSDVGAKQQTAADSWPGESAEATSHGLDLDAELLGHSDWLPASAASDVPNEQLLRSIDVCSTLQAPVAPALSAFAPESRTREHFDETSSSLVAPAQISLSAFNACNASHEAHFSGALSELVAEQLEELELMSPTMNLIAAQFDDEGITTQGLAPVHVHSATAAARASHTRQAPPTGISCGMPNVVVSCPSSDIVAPTAGKVDHADGLQASSTAAPSSKRKGVAALLKGLRSGQVSKIVDVMDSQGSAPKEAPSCEKVAVQSLLNLVLPTNSSGPGKPSCERPPIRTTAVSQSKVSEPAVPLLIASSPPSGVVAASTLPEVRWYPQDRTETAALSSGIQAPTAAAATLKLAADWAGELAGGGARGHTAPVKNQGNVPAVAGDVGTAQNASSSDPVAPRLEIRTFDDLFNL